MSPTKIPPPLSPFRPSALPFFLPYFSSFPSFLSSSVLPFSIRFLPFFIPQFSFTVFPLASSSPPSLPPFSLSSQPLDFIDVSPEILGVSLLGEEGAAYTSTLLRTEGGNTVQITGKHFGYSPLVFIGGRRCEKRSLAENENSQNDATVIECETAAGHGADLKVEVVAGKKVSCSSFVLSYEGPEITEYQVNIPTEGGLYWFTGSNFGLSQNQVVTDLDTHLSKYGGSGFEVGHCKSCDEDCNPWTTQIPDAISFSVFPDKSTMTRSTVHLHNHTHILASILPGIGAGIEFSLNVGGQVCPNVGDVLCQQNYTFHYEEPSVHNISPHIINTDGSTLVEFEGRNFGCCRGDCTSECTDFEDVDVPVVYMDGRVCEVRVFSNDFIQCLAPEGQGIHVKVVVVVGGQQYEETTIDISYASPVIDYFTPTRGPTEGNITMMVMGSNFGRGGVLQLMMGYAIGNGAKAYYDGNDVAMPSDAVLYRGHAQ